MYALVDYFQGKVKYKQIYAMNEDMYILDTDDCVIETYKAEQVVNLMRNIPIYGRTNITDDDITVTYPHIETYLGGRLHKEPYGISDVNKNDIVVFAWEAHRVIMRDVQHGTAIASVEVTVKNASLARADLRYVEKIDKYYRAIFDIRIRYLTFSSTGGTIVFDLILDEDLKICGCSKVAVDWRFQSNEVVEEPIMMLPKDKSFLAKLRLKEGC